MYIIQLSEKRKKEKRKKKEKSEKNDRFAKKSKYFFSEAQGRDWRFRCLARLYLAGGYNIIFTGHTATDRAETALLQLIRGTTLQGMTGFKLTKIYKTIYPKYYNYSIFFNSSF